MRSRNSRRLRIRSRAPCWSRNSLRWKPSGRVSRTVCSMTRGPAKPMRAFGSATLISPSMARLAETPPMVGSVITEMKGRPRWRSRPMAALVLAICIREKRDSCMRAPPLAAKHTRAAPWARAASTPRVKRSPTTEPMEPPMNSNSKAAATRSRPLRRPRMTTRASFSLVSFWAWASRSLYFFRSLNLRGSTDSRSGAISSRPSGSRKLSRRRRALKRPW